MRQQIMPSGPPQWTDEALKEAARRCFNAYARVANKVCGCNIPLPLRVEFDLQDKSPKSAGMASRKGSDVSVSLNMIIYRDNVERVLNEVVPHEVGHIMQFDKFDTKGFNTHGHGPEWKEAVRRIGSTPAKTIDLDLSKSIAHFKELQRKRKAAKKAAKASEGE